MTFADAEYADKCKQTRTDRFLIEMNQAESWRGLIAPLSQG
ncbi:transposase-like protein TnpA3 [Stutzerimonas stutzeri]|nr:transposase-like protein TnpA3 [Stutzerimonas stutzeri]